MMPKDPPPHRETNTTIAPAGLEGPEQATPEESAKTLGEALLPEQLERALDAVSDVYAVYDRDFRMVYQNAASKAAVRLLGIDPDLMIGEIVWDFLPALKDTVGGREAIRAMRDRVVTEWEESLHRDVCQRGMAFPTDDGGLIYVAHDVTAQWRAKAELRDVIDRTERMLAVTSAFGRTVTIEEVAKTTLTHGLTALGAAAGVVYVMNAEGTSLCLEAFEGIPEAAIQQWSTVPLDSSIMVSDAVRAGSPVYIATRDAKLERYPDVRESIDLITPDAWAAIPLLQDGETIGALALGFSADTAFTQSERGFIEALATQCAQAMARARLTNDARASARRARLLADAAAQLTGSLDEQAQMRGVLEVLIPALADYATVSLISPDGALSRVAMHGATDEISAILQELDARHPHNWTDPDAAKRVAMGATTLLISHADDDALRPLLTDADHRALVLRLPHRHMIFAPMRARGETIGILVVGSGEGREVTEADRVLAGEIAIRAAMAIDNARLYEGERRAREVSERAAQWTVRLHSLAARLTGANTPEQVARTLIEEARVAFAVERGTMSLLDEDGETMRSIAAVGYDSAMPTWTAYALRDNPEPLREVVNSGQPVFLASLEQTQAQYPDFALTMARNGVAAEALLPVAVHGSVRGVIGLSWTRARVLSEEERTFMRTFAAQCAQALARAMSFEAERAAHERTERLQRVTAALASVMAESELADVLISNIREVLNPEAIGLYHVVPDEEGAKQLIPLRVDGLSLEEERDYASFPLDGDTPLATIVREGGAVFLPTNAAFQARYPQWPPEKRGEAAEGFVAMALSASTGEALGGIAFGFRAPRTFSEAERRYVSAIVEQAAQALERVRLYQAERAARKAAEDANRAKATFLAAMSHELRTPLNAIGGYAELMSLGIRGPITMEQHEDLERITRSQRHLLSIINDILNFARLEAAQVFFEISDVLVQEIIAGVEPLVAPQFAEREIEYSWSGCEPGLTVRADPERVRQILLNLLANSVKFTGVGGSVALTCETRHDVVLLHVRDTGVGIPRDRLKEIFEPFVQVHRSLTEPTQGTGLGLSISRDMARRMNGGIAVESSVGAGSTFTLTLPRA